MQHTLDKPEEKWDSYFKPWTEKLISVSFNNKNPDSSVVSLITSFFLSGSRGPEVIVISDDEPAMGSQETQVVHQPTDLIWKNGLRFVIPLVGQGEATNVLEFMSKTLYFSLKLFYQCIVDRMSPE